MCCRSAQELSPVTEKAPEPQPSTSGLSSTAAKITRRRFAIRLGAAEEPRLLSAPAGSPKPLKSALRQRPAVEPEIIPAREVKWAGLKEDVEEEKKEPKKSPKVRRTKGRLRKHYFYVKKQKRKAKKKTKKASAGTDSPPPPQMRDRATCTTEVQVAVELHAQPSALPELPDPPEEDPESEEKAPEDEESDSNAESATDDEPEQEQPQAQLA
ncbi:hypothetical protein V5799_015665 [Amblyomma americanum]|uniref:Uncharacterized protein n=1 Tax=Amblyomma americanum TaxID=6943 RepID=A0AAQ4F7Z8_AMBAM